MSKKRENSRIENLDEHEVSPEVPPESDAHRQARSTVALDVLREQSEGVLIEGIKLEHSPEKQPALVTRFNYSVSLETIPVLIDAGIDPDLIRNVWDDPGALAREVQALQIKSPDKFKRWDGSSKAAYEKLIEAARNPTSQFSASWQPKFETLLATTLPRVEDAKTLREHLSDGWDKVKGTAKETVTWARKNPVPATMIGLGIFGVGYLIKRALSKDKNPEKSDDAKTEKKSGEKTWWGKAWKWLIGAGAVGTLAILAKILPTDGIKAFMAEVWKDTWLGKKIEKAEKREKQSQERNELFEKIAEQIGIKDPDILHGMGEYEYEEFVSYLGMAKGFVRGQSSELFANITWGKLADADIDLLPDGVKRFIEKRRNRPRLVAEAEEKLRTLLKKHKEKIEKNVYTRKYVRQVLEGLGREGVFGEKYQNRPVQLDERDATPIAVQRDILLAYAGAEAHRAKAITERVHEHEAKQEEAINGKTGLVARLEHLSQNDPDYRVQAQKVKDEYRKLVAMREGIADAIKAKKPISEMEKLEAAYLEAEEEYNELTTGIDSDIESQLPSWAAIPYFVRRRYAMLESRRRAMVRENVRRVVTLPKDAARAALEARNPVKYLEKAIKEAKKTLKEYTEENSISNKGAKHLAETGQDPELSWKKSRVESLKKELAFQKKKAKFDALSEARKTPSRRSELFKAEYEMQLGRQQRWKKQITYLKSALRNSGEDISERMQIKIMQDAMIERRAIRDSLKSFEKRVMDHVDLIGKGKPIAQQLVQHRDDLIKYHSKVTCNELSLWGSLGGESKGLRKLFCEWLRDEKSSGFTKFAKNKFGRVAVMGALAIPALYFERKDRLEKNPNIAATELYKELGTSGLQLLVDVMPFVGTYSDWHTVVTGEELVTKRKLHGWDRGSRAIWGTLGGLLDAATVIPFVDVVGAPANLIMRSARAAGRANEGRRILRLWPRIKKIAEALGGWKKFAEHIKGFVNGGSKWEKVKHAAAATRVAVPRVMAAATAGSIAYVYTLEDPNDVGVALDPDLVAEVEAEATGAPQLQTAS